MIKLIVFNLRRLTSYPCHLELASSVRGLSGKLTIVLSQIDFSQYSIKLNRPLTIFRPLAFADLRIRMFEVTVFSLLLITLTNCITVAKKSEYLEAPVLVKPFPCSSNPGYEANYIECRFRTLTDVYGNRKRFLEEQKELATEPASKKQIMLVISETDKKLKDLVTWQNANLAGAKKRDEKWQAEEAIRQAEADRIAQIEKMRQDKINKQNELAEMKRTGKKDASECKRAKAGLQECITNAKMGRQGAQVLGALTGVNTSAFQDVASNVELACKTFKSTITIACAFAGESDILEVVDELKNLDNQIKELEKRK